MMSSGDSQLLPERCPGYRWHELISGSFVERGNLQVLSGRKVLITYLVVVCLDSQSLIPSESDSIKLTVEKFRCSCSCFLLFTVIIRASFFWRIENVLNFRLQCLITFIQFFDDEFSNAFGGSISDSFGVLGIFKYSNLTVYKV